MISDQLLDEIERQRKYLAHCRRTSSSRCSTSGTRLSPQRASGYRNTAAAAREIIDNSLEAGARNVHVVLDSDAEASGRRAVSAIAFIDDGPGMTPKMARYALTWGGGTHHEDPVKIGRFGFGLPNSSINQTRRVEVYCRRPRGAVGPRCSTSRGGEVRRPVDREGRGSGLARVRHGLPAQERHDVRARHRRGVAEARPADVQAAGQPQGAPGRRFRGHLPVPAEEPADEAGRHQPGGRGRRSWSR